MQIHQIISAFSFSSARICGFSPFYIIVNRIYIWVSSCWSDKTKQFADDTLGFWKLDHQIFYTI